MMRRRIGVNLNTISGILPKEVQDGLVGYLRIKGDALVCIKCWATKPCWHRRRVTIIRLLIESHVGLVQSIASKFSYHDPPELLSEGLLILTKCVRNYAALEDNNISPYINTSVRRGIMRFVRRNLIQIRVDSRAHVKGKGVVLLSGAADMAVDVRATSQLPLEVRDIVATVVRTDNERIIADCLLGGGYTCQDMADLCNISSSRAQVIKTMVEERIATAWKC